jgi:hypothetical protein
MNYQNVYNQIIERAKTRQLEGYKEKHHIIPRCLGGNDDLSNLVELTAREHILCHMLLCELYPHECKLKHALFLMSIGKKKSKHKTHILSSRVYERLKKEYSDFLTGKKQSKDTKDKKSKAMTKVWANKTKEEMSSKGKKCWSTRVKNGTNKVTELHASKISKALKGRKITWDRKVNTPVSQYDLEGNFIKDWPSISEAARNVKGDIGNCCRGKSKTAGGYIWKYKII